MALPTVPEVLTTYPELVVALAIVVRIARAYQTQLTWPEYRQAHRIKRALFPLVAMTPLGDSILLVSRKGGRDDPEFLFTVEGSVREVVKDLQRAGASLHLINSIKRRPDTHGDPLTAAHVVWFVDGEQVEGYIFANGDGTIDLYAHTEASVTDPLRHLAGAQTDGDTHGVVPDLQRM